MSQLLQIERVRYECSCGRRQPLARLFFCRHACLKLRCQDCAAKEVDSIFCPHCLENMPGAEAAAKRNRCHQCWLCPICTNVVLSVKATATAAVVGAAAEVAAGEKGEGAKSTEAKKAIYLSCAVCRWTTREAGIPDAGSPNAWPQPPEPHAQTLAAVQAQYRHMAQQEKTMRDQKKFTSRRVAAGAAASDKFGLQALIQRKQLGLPVSTKEQDERDAAVRALAAQPLDEVEPFDETLLTQPLDLDSVTSLAQRQLQTGVQPRRTADLLPVRQPLTKKTSLRCKDCEHNLCKSEYSPASIKFKLKLIAMLFVPEVRVGRPGSLGLARGGTTEVELTLTNGSMAPVHVVLLPDVSQERDSNGAPFATSQPPVSELFLPQAPSVTSGSENEGPVAVEKAGAADDAAVVSFRQGHRLGFRLPVSVPADHPQGQDVWLALSLKFDYLHAPAAATPAKEPAPTLVWLTHSLHLNLGKADEAQ